MSNAEFNTNRTSRILEFGLQQKWILDAKYAFLAVERAKKAAGKRVRSWNIDPNTYV